MSDDMPEIENLNATCDFCGREFLADADSFLEGGLDLRQEAEEGEEWKGNTIVSLKPDDLDEETKENLRQQHGLNSEQLIQWLTHGRLEGLAWCVCPTCQDEGDEKEGEAFTC